MFRSVVLPVALLGLLCALRVGLWTAVRCASKALSLSLRTGRAGAQPGAAWGFWEATIRAKHHHLGPLATPRSTTQVLALRQTSVHHVSSYPFLLRSGC